MKDLYFFHGPVGSGRTSKIIQYAYNYESIGKPSSVLIYSHSNTKSKKGLIKSENGLTRESINYSKGFDFFNDLKKRIVDDDMFNDGIELILIDDAHYLTETQVDQLTKMFVSNFGVTIMCFGLKVNNKGNLFEGSKRLFEVATRTEELTRPCWCGKKANMNAKILDGHITKQGEIEYNISSNNYKALCLKHFIKSEMEGKEINNNSADFSFFHGPMSAGKSLEAIRIFYHYKNIGRENEVITFNHAKDLRHGKNVLASKSGAKIPSIGFDDETDFFQYITEIYKGKIIKGERISHILLDEAQFLSKKQVTQLARVSILYDINVSCFGLRTNFLGKLFEGSKRLFEVATTIKESTKLCWCGERANMNARIINGEVIRKGDELMIGGNNEYKTLCLQHFLKGEFK